MYRAHYTNVSNALVVYLHRFFMINFYSPQMVATVNTTKYTIENNLTKKEKKTNTSKFYICARSCF